MGDNKEVGDAGELDIVNLVPCPNCKKKLMILPKNYPLVDVQCTGCIFRAQIKTINSSPKDNLLGAGWEIMNKVLKSGYLIPATFVNFKWENKQEIRFYPFIPRVNLENYQLSAEARRANYKMFRYIGMNDLPYFVLYKK
ncbi:MAG: hypothetical protein AABX35_00945 [Nanoarchaeota archaeon]